MRVENMAHMGKVKNTYKLSVTKPEGRHGRSSVYHYAYMWCGRKV